MKIQTVIFDLDGTLLDSLDDLANSMNRVLESRGFPSHPVKAYRQFIGDGAWVLTQRVLPELERSEAQVKNCFTAFEEDYAENWKIHTNLYPGIAELLDMLTRRGLKIAILSNKPHKFTIIMVEHFLSQWKFESVFGQQPGVAKKPDPAGVFQIANQMKNTAENIVYVGDSGIDMQTAHSAGCYAVGVCWGFRSSEELLAAGASKLISDPFELMSLIDSLES